MRQENENQLTYFPSPLARRARRTGKSEGYIKENTYLIPLIGFECYRTQNHFPRGAARRGGSQTASGFTLIELLVVVLIIGILASVALPQYQFSVDKTRVMTQYQNVQSIIKTEQVYKMANGNYTGDFELLDIDWTKMCTLGGRGHNELKHCPGNFGFQMADNETVPSQIWLRYCNQKSCNSSTTNYHFLMFLSTTDGHIILCSSKTSRGQKLCNYFTQQFGSSSN